MRKGQRERGAGSPRPPGDDAPAVAPELPSNRAFVLQLSRDTGPTLEPFTGRVEHLTTGRRLSFDSFASLQAAVIRLLAERQPERDEGDPGR